MRTKLPEANRKSTERIKEINRLKHQINKDTDINGTSSIIDVIVDQDNNIRRSNCNDERFIDDFVDFKKSVALDFQNINQKIANLNMKDQYPQGTSIYIDKHLNNLATQNARRSCPVVNKYPDRDLLHHKIKNGTTSVVTGNTDFNNTVKFDQKAYIIGTSMIKGIRRKEFNSKLNKCSTRSRPFYRLHSERNGDICEVNLKR